MKTKARWAGETVYRIAAKQRWIRAGLPVVGYRASAGTSPV